MKRGIIFDLDGTLVDSTPVITQAFGSASAACGIINGPSVTEFLACAGTPIHDVCQQIGLPLTFVDHFRAATRQLRGNIPMFPGIASLLMDLAGLNIRMAILTGKNRENTAALLSTLGIQELFGAVVTPESALPPKPSAQPALWICSRLGIGGNDCAFVGDSPVDMQCAVAAGLTAIGCTWGVSTAEQLVASGAHVIAQDVASLRQILSAA